SPVPDPPASVPQVSSPLALRYNLLVDELVQPATGEPLPIIMPRLVLPVSPGLRVILPLVPVAEPVARIRLPEFDVAPSASPVVIVTLWVGVLATLVLFVFTVSAVVLVMSPPLTAKSPPSVVSVPSNKKLLLLVSELAPLKKAT